MVEPLRGGGVKAGKKLEKKFRKFTTKLQGVGVRDSFCGFPKWTEPNLRIKQKQTCVYLVSRQLRWFSFIREGERKVKITVSQKNYKNVIIDIQP